MGANKKKILLAGPSAFGEVGMNVTKDTEPNFPQNLCINLWKSEKNFL